MDGVSSQTGGVGNGPLPNHSSDNCRQDPEGQAQIQTGEEPPALEGDDSESGPGHIEIRDRSVTFHRDSESIYIDLVRAEERTEETPVTQLDLILAATLVLDAKHSRHGHFRHEEHELRLYNLYNHWLLRWAIYFFIFLIHSLALFEDPAVPNLEIPYWATMLIEIVCLAAFCARLIHSKMFTSGIVWWGDLKHLIVIGTVGLTVLDMILYIALTESGIFMVRWSRMLRPLFMINVSEGRQIRRAFRNIRRTLPDILMVLVLFFTLIALFALMALKMFDKRGLKTRKGTPYMSNYWDNYYELYIYVTTANSPDIMMPAYDENYWFCLFFIAYLIICMYIFMSVILAVIYNNYRKNLKTEVQKSVFQRRRALSKAFDIMKIRCQEMFVITKNRFTALMKIVSQISAQLW
ncbi:two pore channel protein 2-like [Ptychodera flava]|uniref:two pore channel protein 2-like n=1 Tax=Ptychodera flava TaxID=63121 RepID=UPI003969DED2